MSGILPAAARYCASPSSAFNRSPSAGTEVPIHAPHDGTSSSDTVQGASAAATVPATVVTGESASGFRGSDVEGIVDGMLRSSEHALSALAARTAPIATRRSGARRPWNLRAAHTSCA